MDSTTTTRPAKLLARKTALHKRTVIEVVDTASGRVASKTGFWRFHLYEAILVYTNDSGDLDFQPMSTMQAAERNALLFDDAVAMPLTSDGPWVG